MDKHQIKLTPFETAILREVFHDAVRAGHMRRSATLLDERLGAAVAEVAEGRQMNIIELKSGTGESASLLQLINWAFSTTGNNAAAKAFTGLQEKLIACEKAEAAAAREASPAFKASGM